MKKLFILFTLFPFTVLSQIQIGQDIDGDAFSDGFGWGVSSSFNGNVIAMGAIGNDGNGVDSGQIKIYENILGVWTQKGQDIYGESANERIGLDISLSSDGNRIAVLSFPNFSDGILRVYEYQSGTWIKLGDDISDDDFFQSGRIVSLSANGNIVAVGGNFNNNSAMTGRLVRVYEYVSGEWIQLGNDILGSVDLIDQFGVMLSLSLDGSTIAVAAFNKSDNGDNSGQVKVYQNISGVWTQIGNNINGENAEDRFGVNVSLSLDGTILAVGAWGNADNGENSGHVKVYQNISGVWTQIGNNINGEASGDSSGLGVSLSSNGNVVAIGARGNDDNGENSGHVRVYQNISGVWTQIGVDIDGEAAYDNSGEAVSLSSDGNKVVIGARYNDGNAENLGHVRVYDLSSVLSSDEFVLSQFNLYPNPAKNKFTIELIEGMILYKVNIYNSLGQFITSTNKKVISTSNFSSGFYHIEVITNKGKATKKLIVD